LLKVGDFGVGVNTGLSIPSGDYNQATVAGRYVGAGASAVNGPSSLAAYGTLQVARGGAFISQYATFGSTASGLRVEFRGSNNGTTWSAWQEIYHTGNAGTAVTADVTTSTTDTTAGRLLKVGDFGVGSTGALTTKTNFDTTTTAGSYYIASGSAVTGSPITATNQGILVVEGKTVGGRIIQTWHYISSSSVDYHSEYRRSYTGSAWTPWAKSHHTGNILAPVSESAGVPTGGVIEAGSNANGNYTKYADGTMICANNIVVSEIGNADTLGAEVLLTHAAVFIATPSMSIWCYGATDTGTGNTYEAVLAIGAYGRLNNSGHRFKPYYLTDKTVLGYASFYSTIAIGRWF